MSIWIRGLIRRRLLFIDQRDRVRSSWFLMQDVSLIVIGRGINIGHACVVVREGNLTSASIAAHSLSTQGWCRVQASDETR
jgi:hypothetical protein